MIESTLWDRIKGRFETLLCRHEPYASISNEQVFIICRKCGKGQGYPFEDDLDDFINYFGEAPPMP